MRIAAVSIENFRSIESLECTFENVTTFVGPNGAGKSTVLRALEWFFNGEKSSIADEDVHAGAGDNRRIRVRVDFDALTGADRAALGSRYAPIEVETFSVWKTWADGEEKVTGRGLAYAPFEAIRSSAGATEKRSLYRELRERTPALGLPAASNAAQVDAAMEAWEREHPRELTEAQISETHFFGFNGRGVLSSLFDFVFVSADLRANDETTDGRDTILGRILQYALDRNELNRSVAALTEEYQASYARLNERHLNSQLEAIGASISSQVSEYSTGRSVNLSATTPNLKPQFPKVEVGISDGSVSTSVGLQGHGLQRTLLLSALTVLSRTSRPQDASGSMFLAIEEPELFQHPTQARAFASVLRELTNENDAVQVAYATHSPYFIEPTFFDQIRRVTNRRSAGALCSSTHIAVATMGDVTRELETYVDPRSIQRRWSQACMKYLPEALFAEAAILVEGDEDAAVLQGLGERTNELAVQGITVASVSGKGNMLLPFAILRLLGITSLMVVDNDSGCRMRMEKNGREEDKIQEAEGEHVRMNRALCRFVGAKEEDFPVGAVASELAFIPDTLESLLASELPGWDLTRRQLIKEGRGVDGKNAATYELASRECEEEPGASLSTILELVRKARIAA